MTFPKKLNYVICQDYDCVEKCGVDSFRVVDREKFEREILLKYFKTKKMASFKRQLNIYGFTRILDGPNKNAYTHKDFIIGNYDRIGSIHRSKKAKSPTQKVTGAKRDRSQTISSDDDDSDCSSSSFEHTTGFKRNRKNPVFRTRELLHNIKRTTFKERSYSEVKADHERRLLRYPDLSDQERICMIGNVDSIQLQSDTNLHDKEEQSLDALKPPPPLSDEFLKSLVDTAKDQEAESVLTPLGGIERNKSFCFENAVDQDSKFISFGYEASLDRKHSLAGFDLDNDDVHLNGFGTLARSSSLQIPSIDLEDSPESTDIEDDDVYYQMMKPNNLVREISTGTLGILQDVLN
jgi:hypothetical protein